MVETKKCPKCDRDRLITDFQLSGGGRRRAQCGECYNEQYRDRDWRQKRGKSASDLAQRRARRAVREAVRAGLLRDPGTCAICDGLLPGYTCAGVGPLEWHHPDTTYREENDLKVIRLHASGHNRLHAALRRQAKKKAAA